MPYNCEICKKEYKSYQTYWTHNKNIHSENNIYISNKERNFNCNNCNKKFTRKDSLKHHITNTCKNKTKETEITQLKNEIKVLQDKVDKLSGNIINNTNNGTINNNVTIIINKIGNENINDLNEQEVKDIFSKKIESLVKFIQHMNFNSRLPSNHSFCTTSLNGQYLTVYNTENSEQQKDCKKYFFENLISKSVDRMEQLYNKYKLKFKKDKQEKIEDDIKTLKNIRDSNMTDTLLREMLKKLNLLSYNYKEIVLKTWNSPDVSGVKEKTFEEDLDDDDSDIKDIEDIFIKDDYDSDCSNDSDMPKLLIKPKKNITV